MNKFFTENRLVEQPAIELFKSLGYSYQDCYNETFGETGTLGRETSTDVVLKPRLKQALINLNIVTDRKELDEQIYKNFAEVGAVTEQEVHAESGKHLEQLLKEDHRNIFTLIHKFGDIDYIVSDRSDIIVITDEAHRTQYDTLAMKMRTALPNAAFIAFTGTPLIVGEELTRKTFGDYVSVYNFKQSIEDNATVPLYYENRIPEVQIKESEMKEGIEQILEEAMLSPDQEEKLQREFSREYHIITRDDRLEKIAEDIRYLSAKMQCGVSAYI